MSKVIIASSNPGKLAELHSYLKPLKLELVLQPKEYDVEETGGTFIENAIIKARYASKMSGLPSIADDSGLVIDALGGEPGVRTARYAGEGARSEQNMDKVLHKLRNFPDVADRQAQFVCVLVHMKHHLDPKPTIASGVWAGSIAHDKRGQNGFGYDPIFYGRGMSQTAAEISLEMKSQFSHRSVACSNLVKKLS